MGAQQILRAAACSALIAGTAAAAPRLGAHGAGSGAKERAAVIDLGPPSADVRRTLQTALVDAGFDPVVGDGIEDALAGLDADRDAIALAAAMADAERAFGKVDCKATYAAAATALPIIAARQAGGIAVPELGKAWSYVLLCADLNGEVDRALHAAAFVRKSGDTTVAPSILAKYPDVDATSDADIVDVDVTSEVPNATLWVDFAEVHATHLALPAGEHVIAAASGSRRGAISGTPVRAQPKLTIPMPDQAGPWAAVATRVAGWHGKMPSPEQLGLLLTQIKTRAVLIRHGDVVEVWGRAGAVEQPRRLGGEDGIRTIAEADRAAALLADRVEGWSSHAPDPDQPLLVEDLKARAKRLAGHDEPTAWWVYATIGAAVLAGATVVYLHHTDTDQQRVELHYP
jgi:hypothetical protein